MDRLRGVSRGSSLALLVTTTVVLISERTKNTALHSPIRQLYQVGRLVGRYAHIIRTIIGEVVSTYRICS
jgi:hypothetical protein